MNAHDQAEALNLLRKWLNAYTDHERIEIETKTRRFLVDRRMLDQETRTPVVGIWARWRKGAR